MNLGTLLGGVLVHVPECPEEIAADALRKQVEEIVQIKGAWTHVHAPLMLQKGNAFYPLDAPAGAKIRGLTCVKVNGVELMESGGCAGGGYRYDSAACELVLCTTPSASIAQGIRVTLLLEPDGLSADDAEVPDFLADYRRMLTHGAVYDLMIIPRQAWSNRDVANWHYKEYHRLLASVRARANRNINGPRSRVKPRRFV